MVAVAVVVVGVNTHVLPGFSHTAVVFVPAVAAVAAGAAATSVPSHCYCSDILHSEQQTCLAL